MKPNLPRQTSSSHILSMFTGLIAGVGKVQHLVTTPGGAEITIALPKTWTPPLHPPLQIGDSIAVDGVCLTVTKLAETTFTAEASPETLSKTILGRYQTDTRVNLEPPLAVGDRLGGHWVSGHVDGTATVVAKEQDGISWLFYFRLNDATLLPLFVPKGSVAINGISLTVNTVEKSVFSVAIIPHTWEQTTMSTLMPDDTVNIEADILGKYIARQLEPYLTQLGFYNSQALAKPPGQVRTGAWFSHEQ